MLSPMTIYQRYRRYLLAAGISHGGKGQGPRLHDIRHTFAVHVLQKWISEEADLTAMIPILSTYMGHKSIRSTARYLRLTAEVYPDLMKKVESTCAYVIPEVHSEGSRFWKISDAIPYGSSPRAGRKPEKYTAFLQGYLFPDAPILQRSGTDCTRKTVGLTVRSRLGTAILKVAGRGTGMQSNDPEPAISSYSFIFQFSDS